jgi:ankyrin repeat protein
LVERGAHVAAGCRFDTDGYIIWHAGGFADKELIEMLLSRGLDVNCSSFKGYTCLHLVAEREGKNEKELIGLAILLIQAGVDFFSKNDSLSSPLRCASHAGNSGIIKQLLEKMPKEELDVKSAHYGTPLYAAAFRGHLELVQILLEADANTNAGWLEQTPLEAAQDGDHEEVAKLLLEHQQLEGENGLSTFLD